MRRTKFCTKPTDYSLTPSLWLSGAAFFKYTGYDISVHFGVGYTVCIIMAVIGFAYRFTKINPKRDAYYYGMKNMVYHAVGYLTQSAYIAVQMYASHEAATAGTGQEAHELQLSAAGGSDIYAASGFFNDWGIPSLVLMLLEEERADYGNILCILVLFSLTLPYPTLFVHTSRYLTLMRSTAMQLFLITYIVFQARHVLYVLHEIEGRVWLWVWNTI